ncbi:hypothetical protein ACIBH1_47065 [Nonomuraea sp. NPDC050663]|uniref:hypothetical protein n=1 Tax=Nonomuraea sp. NPDC050663 TaxID=3364370 RepID=UPI0037BC174C
MAPAPITHLLDQLWPIRHRDFPSVVHIPRSEAPDLRSPSAWTPLALPRVDGTAAGSQEAHGPG